MFCQHTRLRYDTFCDLIRVLGPSYEEKNTNIDKTSMQKLE